LGSLSGSSVQSLFGSLKKITLSANNVLFMLTDSCLFDHNDSFVSLVGLIQLIYLESTKFYI
jgi:hypothetical protein